MSATFSQLLFGICLCFAGPSLPGHQIFLVVNGIHLLENIKMDELAAKRVYEFAFVLQPLKLYGATGSTVAPAAIR